MYTIHSIIKMHCLIHCISYVCVSSITLLKMFLCLFIGNASYFNFITFASGIHCVIVRKDEMNLEKKDINITID